VQKGTAIKKPLPSFSDVFGTKLVSLAKRDEKIVAITAAMPKGTGLDIFQREFPKRFYDVGIAEPHAVGFASGLAKGGFKPVVAIYSTFLQRSFDQIIHDVALQKLPVVFAVDRAGLVGEDGPTHHGVFDVGYLRLIPNMACMAPKDKEEFEDMLEFALQLNTPVSIRYPRAEAYSLNNRQPVELGKSQILIEEGEICLLALGTMTKIALECASLLKQDNINVTIINARFIKPLDEELLNYLANKMRLIVTLEDSNLDCGFGSAVLEFYEKTGQLDRVRLVRTGLPAEFLSGGGREKLLKIYGLDALSLATRIKKVLSQVEILWNK
jgi:1-deoxy-D-xylulose-5-phosphate synthase